MAVCLSGNTCAFPGCAARLVKAGVIVGEICHIRARELGGPRYDPNYEDVDAFANQILMCGVDHKVIDTKPEEYPVEMLDQLKRRHEERFEQPSDEALEGFIISVNDGSIITTHNQQGGQTAHQITNIFHEPAMTRVPSLVPVIDCHMTGSDNQIRIDTYDFRIKLRNDSEFTVRGFRLEVEIPKKYATSATISAAEVPWLNKPEVKCYRRTQETLRAFTLYPGEETEGAVLSLGYYLRHEEYKDVNESIALRLYVGDALLSANDYSIRNYRNKDRLDQLAKLGLPEGEQKSESA